MAKMLRCGDVIPGCGHEIRGENEEEVLRKGAEHAKNEHGVQELTPEQQEQARHEIHDAPNE